MKKASSNAEKQSSGAGLVGAGVPARPRGASGGSRVSASAGEENGRVERNGRVEHKEHKELGELWPKVRLGEVCEEKVKRIRTLAPKTTIAYIDIGSVCRERKRILTTTQYSVEDAPGRAQQLVQKGDLLVSTVRPNLNAVALVEEDADLPLVASTGFCVLRAKAGLDSRYAYYFSQAEAFISQLVSVSEKASYPSVTDTVVKSAEIPLPPLSVQRAVVARLEGEMKAVGRLEAGFREMGAAAEAAFTAELAEAFAVSAGAGEVFDAKCAKSNAKNAKASSGGPRVSASEENGRVEHKEHKELGEPWPKARLGEVCETGAGGTPLKQHSEYYDGGDIPWLRSGEVCQKDICKTELFITKAGMANSSAKLFPANSVVVAMYGATAGQVGILRIEATTNQAVCAIFPNEKYLPEFLYYQLCNLKSVMVEQARGGAQPNISQIKIRSLEISLPPLAVQRAVVSRLEAAAGRRARLVALAAEGAAAAADLRKAILKETFEPPT